MSDELGGIGGIDQAAGQLASEMAGPPESMMVDEGRSDDDLMKEEDHVRLWFNRVHDAKRVKAKWEDNYEVQRSHDYVRGFQRGSDEELDAQGEPRYTINKILANLKVKLPRLFYYHPYIRVRPTRGREDTPGQLVSKRAQLLQDTINTVIRAPQTRFKPEALAALKEAHWAFGIVEVGYDADWTENPFKRKPILIDGEDEREELEKIGKIQPELDDDDDPITSALQEAFSDMEEIPQQESFFVKHIPASQFYVATNDRIATESMDWIGYWEWMQVEDVKRAYDNTEDIRATGMMTMDEAGHDKDLMPTYESGEEIPANMVRVWKIWDQRERIRYVLAEGHKYFLREGSYDYCPIFDLRFEVMPGEWYPIPPIFQQLMEQDEFNDSREYLRMVRKGTRPRFIYDKQSFTAAELEKLENDEFGVFIGTDNGNMTAIAPINQPTFSDTALRVLGLAEAGFTEQAGSSPVNRLTRGGGGTPTATEVGAMEESSDVRDSYEQQQVADWLASVSSGILQCAVDKMTLAQWVILNSDPSSPQFQMDGMQIAQVLQTIYTPIPNLEQLAQAANTLQQMIRPQAPTAAQGREMQVVTPDDLEQSYGVGDWDVTVDIESLSPVSESQHASRIMQALQLISSPGPGELLAISPELLKTMLNLMGIRSAEDQAAISNALMMQQQMRQMMMMMQLMGGGGSMPGQKGVAPMAGGPQSSGPSAQQAEPGPSGPPPSGG
jgi:hypothetical protein